MLSFLIVYVPGIASRSNRAVSVFITWIFKGSSRACAEKYCTLVDPWENCEVLVTSQMRQRNSSSLVQRRRTDSTQIRTAFRSVRGLHFSFRSYLIPAASRLLAGPFDDRPTRENFHNNAQTQSIVVLKIRPFFSLCLLPTYSQVLRMSKSSTATASKTSAPLTKSSAWSKGPPSASSRSQSPAPSASTPAQPPAPHLTHSRRPSALGQGVPIKDGVSIPRNNVGAVKQQGLFTSSSSLNSA